MTRGVGGQSPANVQTHLKGVSYPASKEDLLSSAKTNDAPEEVMEILRQMPDQQFHGPQDVMKAYGDIK